MNIIVLTSIEITDFWLKNICGNTEIDNNWQKILEALSFSYIAGPPGSQRNYQKLKCCFCDAWSMITSNNARILWLPFIPIVKTPQIGSRKILVKKCTKKKANQFQSHDLILLLFIINHFVIRSESKQTNTSTDAGPPL